MNYIKELKAFKDWMLLNDLPTSAIALWHTLMAINNMTGWKEHFNAPNSTVEKLTGLSKQGLVDARKKLLENGLIDYEKGKKGKAPVYKLVSLVNSLDQYDYQSVDQYTYQSDYQSTDQSLTIPKHKQNKTKTNNKVNDSFGDYTNNPDLIDALNDFKNMRKQMKKPLTDRAMSMLLNKLDKMASDDDAKIMILEQSIFNNWQGVFPLRQSNVTDLEKHRRQKENNNPNWRPIDLEAAFSNGEHPI